MAEAEIDRLNGEIARLTLEIARLNRLIVPGLSESRELAIRTEILAIRTTEIHDIRTQILQQTGNRILSHLKYIYCINH